AAGGVPGGGGAAWLGWVGSGAFAGGGGWAPGGGGGAPAASGPAVSLGVPGLIPASGIGWRSSAAARRPQMACTRLSTSKGTIVAAACGMRDTAAAILSAVRSCSSLPTTAEYVRRGRIAVTPTPGSSASALTSSAAHLASRRSGQSTKSSTMPVFARTQSRRRVSAWALSITKCTACSEVGRRLRAYRSPAIVARSKLSTNTKTVRREYVGGSGGLARGPVSDSTCASIRYCRLSLMNANTRSGNTTTTSQAPSVNLTIAKIITTSAVYAPPTTLITVWRRHAGPRFRRWKRAMPNPAIVKPVNTP